MEQNRLMPCQCMRQRHQCHDPHYCSDTMTHKVRTYGDVSGSAKEEVDKRWEKRHV